MPAAHVALENRSFLIWIIIDLTRFSYWHVRTKKVCLFFVFVFFFWKEISETIFSIESFLYECLVISLLFEADKITKADTQNKSVADVVATDHSNERENVVDVLQMRLNDYHVEMEDTAGDGTQPSITCSKLTIETLEQSVKYVKS